MKHDPHEQLLRLLQGELPPEEAERIRQALDRSPALRAGMEELKALRGLLRTTVRASADDALRPFFADRLMRRLAPISQRLARPSAEEELFGSLLRLFRPVALAGLLIVVGFAAYNVTLSAQYEAEPTATEAVFALPPVSLATAYDLDLPTTPPTAP